MRRRMFVCLIFIALTVTPLLSQQNTEQMAAGDWRSYNRDVLGQRYSPLREINGGNVARLQPHCTYDSDEKSAFETGPVAVDGVIYFTTMLNTYAVDGDTCKLRWKQTEALTKEEQKGLGVNRGAAYADGRVFRGFNDGKVVALDAATGKAIWSTRIADPTKGESIPAAPLAWGGMVFIGNAGGDNFGVTGRVYALDQRTGKVLWQFDVVPKTGETVATWPKQSEKNPPTGGATWTSYQVDPQASVLWVGTGNAAPDFILAMHPGDSLYTTCILALDAKTGKLLAFVQPVKKDFHDWDMATPPALVKTRGGRSLAIASSKDGLVYGIDRSGAEGGSGKTILKVLYQTPATTRLNVDTPLSSERFTRFCPGSQGGAEWNGPAYSMAENLVFVPEIDWCTSVKLASPQAMMNGKPGDSWAGTHDQTFGKQDPISKWKGWVVALDADSGKIAWKYRAPTPVAAAVTATGGGLVFTADMNGNLVALAAKTGKKLWSHATGQPIGGGIISFESHGHQFIAVAAGLSSPIWPKQGDSSRLIVYGLK